ncbi:hypothetical protein CQR47_0057 [Bifidobacterium thermophilum]|uniref:Uncharacterized protein n=1 Tax=Bifidobacterium thermophilum TaxID=33905 RepID=A0A2N3QNN8_9BIFI|nr:hypothetical protein CQR48_0110 [Bifidobacterium thermophilum]PKU93283.1 hypothetical protein CQR47_0057 [Bifidobacterium thermophilum]
MSSPSAHTPVRHHETRHRVSTSSQSHLPPCKISEFQTLPPHSASTSSHNDTHTHPDTRAVLRKPSTVRANPHTPALQNRHTGQPNQLKPHRVSTSSHNVIPVSSHTGPAPRNPPPCEPILTKSPPTLQNQQISATATPHPTNPITNWLGHKIADWTDSVMDFKQSARHNDA